MRCVDAASVSFQAAHSPSASQNGFVDWSAVDADDLPLPEDDALGVETCAAQSVSES